MISPNEALISTRDFRFRDLTYHAPHQTAYWAFAIEEMFRPEDFAQDSKGKPLNSTKKSNRFIYINGRASVQRRMKACAFEDSYVAQFHNGRAGFCVTH